MEVVQQEAKPRYCPLDIRQISAGVPDRRNKKNSDIAVYGFPLEARLNLGQYFVDFRHKISLTHSRTDLTAPEPNQILLNDGNTETRACCPVEN